MPNFIAPQGINFRSEYELPPILLSKALIATVRFLQSVEPVEAALYRYADWWEHDERRFADGIITKCSVDFAALSQLVEAPNALLNGMPGDFCVFVGVSPQDFDWYLRFYLDLDAEENERFGRFDLTLPTGLAMQYTEQVIKPLGLKMQEQDAGAYYQLIQT